MGGPHPGPAVPATSPSSDGLRECEGRLMTTAATGGRHPGVPQGPRDAHNVVALRKGEVLTLAAAGRTSRARQPPPDRSACSPQPSRRVHRPKVDGGPGPGGVGPSVGGRGSALQDDSSGRPCGRLSAPSGTPEIVPRGRGSHVCTGWAWTRAGASPRPSVPAPCAHRPQTRVLGTLGPTRLSKVQRERSVFPSSRRCAWCWRPRVQGGGLVRPPGRVVGVETVGTLV